MENPLNNIDEDPHYCLKCKKIVNGLDNYVVHRKLNCSSVTPGNEPLISQINHHIHLDPSVDKLEDKELDDGFDNGVIDLSTSSTKRIEDQGKHHQSLLRSDVTLTSSSVRQHEDHGHNYKQVKLFNSGGYVEPYSEVDAYSNFVPSRGSSLFTDYRSQNIDSTRNKELFSGHHSYSASSDLFQPSNPESSGVTLFRPLESLNDQLKSPSRDVENSGYFSHFTGGKYIVEPQNYENRITELYGTIHVATSSANYLSPGGSTETNLFRPKPEGTSLTIDSHDSTITFQKPNDLEKVGNSDKTIKNLLLEKELRENDDCTESIVYQNHPDEIKQDDFLSSLELTSNVGKKILKYASEEEDDDDFDETRPPRNHTGGKWPPGTLLPPPAEGKWLLSPTLVEEDDEPQVEFDDLELKPVNPRHPPPSYSKGKWLPGKKMTSFKFGIADEYVCKPCDRILKGKVAYDRHLQSELHFTKSKRFSEESLQDSVTECTPPATRPQRAKKLQAEIFLKRTISQIKSKKLKTTGSTTKSKSHLKKESANNKEEENSSSEEEPIQSDSKILCPICRLTFSKEYCAHHFASLAHIHNELEYKLNPHAGTDQEYNGIIHSNIESLVALSHFKCVSCRFYTNSQIDFEMHFRQHTEDDSDISGEMKTVYTCSACPEDVETFMLKDLKRHLQTSGHLTNVKAEILQAHQVSIKSCIRLCCPLCQRSFQFNRAYRNHRRSYHGESSFQLSQQRILHCSECPFQGTSEQQIRGHLRNIHKMKSRKLFFCFVCGLRFSTSKEAEAHRQSVVHRTTIERCKGKPISRRCNICYTETESIMMLRLHMTEHHTKEITPCPYCGILPPLRSDLTNHLRSCSRTEIASLEKEYNCELCGFSNDLYAHVLMHIVFAHGVQEPNNYYSCHVCKSRMQARSVRNHMLLHTSEWKFLCKFCSRRFAHEPWLLSHVAMVHPLTDHANHEEICPVDSRGGEECDEASFNHVAPSLTKEILCEICGKTFKSKSSLKRHQHDLHIFCTDKMQSEIKPGKVTLGEKEMLVAKTKETSQNILMCDVCGKGCNNSSELKCHRATHRNENVQGASYPCPHCSYSTPRMHHLKRHLRLHTGATPFKCSYCHYSANNQENLRKHLLQTQKHAGRFMYECQLCLKKTWDSQNNVGSGAKKNLGVGKQSTPVAVFGSNYATEFRTHLNTEHKDHFRDKDEIMCHIRSYYHSDQDSTFTENPKPFKHKSRKRQSRLRPSPKNLPGDAIEEMAIDEEDVVLASPDSTLLIPRSNASIVATSSSAIAGNIIATTSTGNFDDRHPTNDGGLILYAAAEEPYPCSNKIVTPSSAAAATFDASNLNLLGHSGSTGGANPPGGAIPSSVNPLVLLSNTGSSQRIIVRSSGSTRVSSSSSESFSSATKQSFIPQVSSNQDARNINIQGPPALSHLTQNQQICHYSPSTPINPTVMKVYINKSTNKAYIVRNTSNNKGVVVPKAHFIGKSGPTSSETVLSCPATFTNNNKVQEMNEKCAGTSRGSPELLQTSLNTIEEHLTSKNAPLVHDEQNVSKKFFLIIPNDKCLEEQVMNILPSLDL